MPAPHPEELAGLSRSEVLRASPTMFDTKWLDKVLARASARCR